MARASGYENLLRLLHQLLTSEQLVRAQRDRRAGGRDRLAARRRAAEAARASRSSSRGALAAGGAASPGAAPRPLAAPAPAAPRRPAPARAAAPPPHQRAGADTRRAAAPADTAAAAGTAAAPPAPSRPGDPITRLQGRGRQAQAERSAASSTPPRISASRTGRVIDRLPERATPICARGSEANRADPGGGARPRSGVRRPGLISWRAARAARPPVADDEARGRSQQVGADPDGAGRPRYLRRQDRNGGRARQLHGGLKRYEQHATTDEAGPGDAGAPAARAQRAGGRGERRRRHGDRQDERPQAARRRARSTPRPWTPTIRRCSRT